MSDIDGFPSTIAYVVGNSLTKDQLDHLISEDSLANIIYWKKDPRQPAIDEHNPVVVVTDSSLENSKFGIDTIVSHTNIPIEAADIITNVFKKNYSDALQKFRNGLETSVSPEEFVPNQGV